MFCLPGRKPRENRNTPVDVCEDGGAIVAEGRAGCLKLFEETLAKEFNDYRYGRIHRMTVDAYSLQHPDKYSSYCVRWRSSRLALMNSRFQLMF